jgi:hypothetical protein
VSSGSAAGQTSSGQTGGSGAAHADAPQAHD